MTSVSNLSESKAIFTYESSIHIQPLLTCTSNHISVEADTYMTCVNVCGTCANDWFILPHMPSPSHTNPASRRISTRAIIPPELVFFGSARRTVTLIEFILLVRTRPYQRSGAYSILGPNRLSLRTGRARCLTYLRESRTRPRRPWSRVGAYSQLASQANS